MKKHIKKLNQMLDNEFDLQKRNQINIDLLILKICTNKVILKMTLKKYGLKKEESLKSSLIGRGINNDFTDGLISYSEPIGIIKLVTKNERPLIKFKGSSKAFVLLTRHLMESRELVKIISANYFDKGLTEDEIIIFSNK